MKNLETTGLLAPRVREKSLRSNHFVSHIHQSKSLARQISIMLPPVLVLLGFLSFHVLASDRIPPGQKYEVVLPRKLHTQHKRDTQSVLTAIYPPAPGANNEKRADPLPCRSSDTVDRGSGWVSCDSSPGADTRRVCGNRPLVEDFRGSRVVGGKDAEPGNWPWAVSIQEDVDNEYFHVCGGTVLNHLWVLTAAHCFNDHSNDTWRLVFGANQLSDMGTNAQIRTVIERIKHEKYNPEMWANDIALLRLNKPLIFDNYTQPACLPAKQAILHKMDDCYIAGWGYLEEGLTETSDILQEAPVNLIPVKLCNRPTWYNGAVRDYNVCAGYEQGGIDSCQGDSGGPLMCKKSKAKFYSVVGITSWGAGCGQKQKPGVYTSTQYYLRWISKHMSKEKKSASKSLKMKAAEKIWPKLAEKISKAGMKAH
ncbi:acrosin-like [Spea bombifrons]|uniref:acrosin-like n=1 Tax=Spea bombifrons TaxID=233779 RepID=UPI0023490F13|nr:acrosin-like [Spea bombifrons]